MSEKPLKPGREKSGRAFWLQMDSLVETLDGLLEDNKDE
jgi:hypothetical protein